MKTNIFKILFIIFEGIVYYLIKVLNISIPCFIKKLTDIPCPSCGLTRSFLSIFALDFRSAIYYNILGIPLFLFLITLNIIILIDIFFKKNNTCAFLDCIGSKYYFIIVLLIITEIINIYHYA